MLLGGFVVFMTKRVIKNRQKKSSPGRIRRSPPNLGDFFFSATQKALFFSAIIIENRRFRRSPTEAEPKRNTTAHNSVCARAFVQRRTQVRIQLRTTMP